MCIRCRETRLSLRQACLLVSTMLVVLFSAPVVSGQVVPPRRPGAPRASGAADSTRFIVTFLAGTTATNRAAAVQRAGGTVRFNYTVIDATAITAPNANVLNALRQDRSVLSIVPDRPIYAFQKGGKPGGGNGPQPTGGSRQIIPLGVQRVGFPTATSNGAGIGIAIPDSGIDLTHPDLPVSNSKFDAFNGACQDEFGHATHIAGIIAAKDNNQDVIGVAPAATLYCVKVLDSTGNGTDGTAIAGLDWIAANHNKVTPPIRVVNVSWGRPYETGETLDPPGPLRQAIQALYNLGIVVVAAAGNDPDVEVSALVPSGFPEVLAVAATTADYGSDGCAGILPTVSRDTATFFTTDGAYNDSTRIGVTASAPGDEREGTLLIGFYCYLIYDGILSTRLGGGVSRAIGPNEAAGTSFAAPHVVGVVARLMQFKGLSGVETIRSEIRNTADRKGFVPLDHPWAGTISYTFDGEREGMVQAPR